MVSTRTWRGLTLGADPYYIVSETGLDDITVRSGTRPFPRSDGAIPGRHYAERRTVVVEGWCAGDTPAEAEDRATVLRAATTPSETALFPYGFVMPDGTEGFVRARVLRRSQPRSVGTETRGLVRWSVAFEVPDPRIYTVARTALLYPFSAVDGGVDLDVDLDVDFEVLESESGSLVNVVNGGNSDAFPLVQVAAVGGTVTAVTLSNLTNGDEMSFTVPVAVTDGQTLTIDFPALVLATGDPVVHVAGVSRFPGYPFPVFRLSPGVNTLSFSADGTSTATAARLSWHDTSL